MTTLASLGPHKEDPTTQKKAPRVAKPPQPLELECEVKSKTGEWLKRTLMTDDGCQMNVVKQMLVKELGLEPKGRVSPAINFDGRSLPLYGLVTLCICVTDSNGKRLEAKETFVAVQDAPKDIVLGLPFLVKHDPIRQYARQRMEWRRRHGLPPNTATDTEPKEHQALLAGALVVLADTLSKALKEAPATVVTIPPEYNDLEDVFGGLTEPQLPKSGQSDHAVDLEPNRKPPFGPLYNLSATELNTLRAYLDKNLESGLIRRSISSAASSMMFVAKKDGNLRPVVDYRALNSITIKNRYPLPLITEALDRLSGARIFTKLDIRDAYNMIRIKEGDEWKTAFRTRFGLFEYLVLLFGLTNAPATFQAYINRALSDYLDVICIAYIDDILIFSKNKADHIVHVRRVLERLRKFGLFVKLSKCEFFVFEIGFLGFRISARGIFMEPERVATIAQWTEPRSIKDIQVFLGFANFYRRFIQGFSRIAMPLNEQLKTGPQGRRGRGQGTKGQFVLSPESKEAFRRLKEAFVTAPVMRHFDEAQPIRVETDASGFAVSAILTQPGGGPETERHWHPTAYWSRKMEPAERNYATPDQEMLAIVCAFKHWRHYLEGARHEVIVLTDHANLRTFMTTKTLSRRQVRWAEQLSAYNLRVEYRAGRKNPADGPSRRPDYEREAANEDAASIAKTAREHAKHGEQPELKRLQEAKAEKWGAWLAGALTRSRRRPEDTESEDPKERPLRPQRYLNDVALTDEESSEVAGGPVHSNSRKGLGDGDAVGDSGDSGVAKLKENPPETQTAGASVAPHCVPLRGVGNPTVEEPTYVNKSAAELVRVIDDLQEHDSEVNIIQRRLATLRDRRQDVEGDARDYPGLHMWNHSHSGRMLYSERIFVPRIEKLRREIIRRHHDDMLAGHFGHKRTLELIH